MDRKQQFDEFIVGYLDTAHKLAAIYIKKTEDVEDVVAEAIIKAMQNIDGLKEPAAIKVWFNKIIVNTCINHLKKQSRGLLKSKRMPNYYFVDFSRMEFESLIDILSPRDRQIVSLRFCDDHELKEIARIMDMNENTVRTRLYRSMKKLKLKIVNEQAGLAVKADTKESIVKSVATWSIAILLSVTLLLHLVPPFAAAAYNIPVIGDIVKIITFNRFSYTDAGYEAEVNVPEIQGLLDEKLQDKLNAEFREYADNLIRSFEASLLEFEQIEQEDSGTDAQPLRMSVKADYIVKTDNDRVLAIDAYLYSEVNGYTLHKFITIDKQNKAPVTLAGLFKADADYVTPISAYITAEMMRQNVEEDATFDVGDSLFATFSGIRPDQNFYIDNDGKLVICFDKYEVAAGSQGSPEFVIPEELIRDIVISDLI